MTEDTVLGKDVDNEELGKSRGIDSVEGQNEDALLAESIYNDEDGGKTVRNRKLLDEVYREGVPWLRSNWELL